MPLAAVCSGARAVAAASPLPPPSRGAEERSALVKGLRKAEVSDGGGGGAGKPLSASFASRRAGSPREACGSPRTRASSPGPAVRCRRAGGSGSRGRSRGREAVSPIRASCGRPRCGAAWSPSGRAGWREEAARGPLLSGRPRKSPRSGPGPLGVRAGPGRRRVWVRAAAARPLAGAAFRGAQRCPACCSALRCRLPPAPPSARTAGAALDLARSRCLSYVSRFCCLHLFFPPSSRALTPSAPHLRLII